MKPLPALTLVLAFPAALSAASEAPALHEARPRPARPAAETGLRYSLDQAISDKAQLHTIAFDGLAFLTGDFAFDTFLPPGKVSDYFGFQYMRDIDATRHGHNTSFLTRIALNTLAIMNEAQRARFISLAEKQGPDIRRFAELRLPLIAAFRRNLAGDLPAGSAGLSREAVVARSEELYALDGRLALERAQTMAEVYRSLDDTQRAALAKLKFGDFGSWPEAPETLDRQALKHETHVAVMTYASEMFSWVAGNLDADVYFCPERHGMYFGGFGMKTAPAMGKKDYSISTTLTGDSGAAFLAALDQDQRKRILDIIDLQRADLKEIVSVRREIATELRRLLAGEAADAAKIEAASRRYGRLDGALSYLYADAFARVGRSLTAEQKPALAALRHDDPQARKGPFLYSTPIKDPKIGETDSLFTAAR